MLLTEKRQSAKMAKPQIQFGSAHIVYYMSQYLSEVKYYSIQTELTPCWPYPFVIANDAHHTKPSSPPHPTME